MAERGSYRAFGTIAVLAATIGLAGCNKAGQGLTGGLLGGESTVASDADPMSTASTGPSFKRTEELSKKWTADQSDPEVGLAYAANLGQLGQKETQVQVLRSVAAKNGQNAAVQEKVGKQFLMTGEYSDAADALEKATQAPDTNATTFSALGSAYDQQGRYDLARNNYAIALQKKPNDPGILNNLAMSYALEGKLPEAEKNLKIALSQPSSKDVPRVRQNLALVVGLQGRFDEARNIASEDLPPDQVEANLAYLQQMLSQPNTWQQLSEQGETPPG
jgi:Flp pilus assembly protein TadD